MDEEKKTMLIKNMTDNLPTLRKKMDITQQTLASMLGISRATLVSIENRRTTMSWNMFLSLLLIFSKNTETDKLLNVLEIYTDDLTDFIKHKG